MILSGEGASNHPRYSIYTIKNEEAKLLSYIHMGSIQRWLVVDKNNKVYSASANEARGGALQTIGYNGDFIEFDYLFGFDGGQQQQSEFFEKFTDYLNSVGEGVVNLYHLCDLTARGSHTPAPQIQNFLF